MNPILAARGLGVARGSHRLVDRLDLALVPGEIVAVVGPNGAGKSSLLATLAGLLPPAAGEIRLDGHPLTRMTRREIARLLGFLPQEIEDPYPATVLETALIGRHPHIGFWRWESAADVAKARSALRRVGLGDAVSRNIATLSGGERRRLAIAALLAQAPKVYLLDEPLDMLDLAYQSRFFKLLERLAKLAGVAVLVSLHDLGFAVRRSKRVILLDGKGRAEIGPPLLVLTARRLREVYGCAIRILEAEGMFFFLAD